LHDG